MARRLAASAVGGRWSRLWIDLNRRVDDPTLIRRRAAGRELSWNLGIGPDDVERRMLDVHAPYHVEIDRLILRRMVRGVRPLLLAVHTFTPVFRGRRRPFEIGVLYDRHRVLAHRLGRSLRGSGLSIVYNRPYSGMAGMMYSVDRHGSHHGLPCLEIEVTQAIADEPARVRRLAGVVAESIRKLSPAG
jgi:predicted N-formylglutamate amidohydrolase